MKLVVQYDGANFHGWQAQRVERTVQGVLEGVVERLTGSHRTILGSGRTDSGVHALGQVASLDVPVKWTAAELRRAMNALLPGDAWVAEAAVAEPRFHPRYHATARTYLYRLGLAPEAASPFHHRWCWVLDEDLDGELLERGAALLAGSHSFRAFAKSGQPQRGYRCIVERATWTPWEPLGLEFRITADRYLHRMVRYLVGTMVDVALGRRALEEISALLAGTAPELETSPPAPPEGLFLALVEYADATETREPGSEPRSGS